MESGHQIELLISLLGWGEGGGNYERTRHRQLEIDVETNV